MVTDCGKQGLNRRFSVAKPFLPWCHYYMSTAATYRIKGVNGDEDTCSLCGKRGLKRVVWLAEVDDDGHEGEAAHYGTDCAGLLLHGAKTAGNTKTVLTQATMIETARNWLAKGHSPDVVCKGIWNRYGYGGEVRDGVVCFYLGKKNWTPVVV
jgi:hypothetical protein